MIITSSLKTYIHGLCTRIVAKYYCDGDSLKLYHEITDWVENSVGDYARIDDHLAIYGQHVEIHIDFEREEDAALFKLFWS